MNEEQRIQQKIQEVFDNEEVLGKVFSAETPNEMVNVLKENGVIFVDVSDEDVFEAFQNAKRAQTDELTEDDLEDVAGGVYLALKAGAFYFAVSGSVGAALCVAGGVALIGLATYAAYRYIKKRTA